MSLPPSPTARDQLFRLISGYQASQAVMVAAGLGLADQLRCGPRCSGDLATATGTEPRSLYRLLRALAAIGILREAGNGRFELTEVGAYLRSDVDGSHAHIAKLFGRSNLWAAWGELLQCIKSGSPAFDHVHGEDVWSYRARRPEESAIFDAAMGAGTSAFAEAVMAVTDFGSFAHIVDVGGGDGSFLAELLTAHVRLTGTLFDQPHVIEASGALGDRPEIAPRCRMVAGDFFQDVPSGADAYLVKWILHDWDDEAAVEILSSCRRAMQAQSRLIVVEHLIGPAEARTLATLMDLHMMVVTGGKVRTESDHARLFEEAGLRIVSVVPTSSPLWVIEGTPSEL